MKSCSCKVRFGRLPPSEATQLKSKAEKSESRITLPNLELFMLPAIPASAGIGDQIWASGHIAVKHLAYANASRHSRREKSSREKQRRPEKARESKRNQERFKTERERTDWNRSGTRLEKKGDGGKPRLSCFSEKYTED